MREDYVELHARSSFSFLEGASLPEELISVCSSLKGPAMALLDRDGVYGAPRFHMAAKKAEVKAHIGAEISLLFETDHASRITHHSPRHASPITHHEPPRITHHSPHHEAPRITTLPLLVENRTGYQNLCRLITLIKLRAPKHAKPGEVRATLDELAQHSEGLSCLTGGDDGPLAYALGNGGLDEAITLTERLVDIFGIDHVYAELQRHFNREEESRNQAVVEIARRLRLPLLATNGVCYASAPRRQLADVLTCIRNHVPLETAGRLLARNAERYLKPASAMWKLFADLPEAVSNTLELSSRLGFTLQDLGYEFPKYPVPDGETMDSFLRKRTCDGARLRYTGANGMPTYQRALKQIDRELILIEKLHLAGYFLIVWDIINFCRDERILVQGRGSAANSAVCYSLGITAVDPVGMELLFERFLSEERGEWPDIDLDLPSGDQRERVIQHVYQRYGTHGAAMTANVITYRGRSAAREVGKAMGFDEETVGRLSSLVRTFEWQDPNDTTERQFRDAGLNLLDPRIKKFFELYVAVQDLPRHLGQHSGGMVICQGQLDSVVPLEPAAMPGRVVVQWDKEDCADMGIIKVDLLGLGMMAAIEECLILIRDHYDEKVDLAHLPQDDPAVYDALQKADTIGLFQVESRAQMSCLPRLRPQKFYDIVVQVAIIRPGPIVGNMVHPYLNRRLGREEPACLHPSLEPVLKRTLGVPLFQEQLLRIAMICANFTGGEAEDLRRAMGFKRSEARMREIDIKLRRGMERNGITGETQDKIVQAITSFALYGFPESHAASFALIAYASAYLKCHYLAAFTTAILNNQPMGFYQPATIITDAQRHGLKINPVDITCSDWECTVEMAGDEMGVGGQVTGDGDRGSGIHEAQSPYSTNTHLPTPVTCHPTPTSPPAPRRPSPISPPVTRHPTPDTRHPTPVTRHPAPTMRLGMRYVKGLREEAARAIVRERVKGPFVDIDDLHNRVPELRKDEMRKLAQVGALNFIRDQRSEGRRQKAEGRRQKSAILSPQSSVLSPQSSALSPQSLHRRSALWQVERAARAVGPLLKEQKDSNADSPLPPMTIEERVNADFRGTGLTVGKHPLAYRREELNKLGVKRAIDLREIRNGVWVRVAGWVIVRQRPGTAKGFLFLSMEDETGIANVIVTPNVYDHNRSVLVSEPLLLIDGVLQNQDGVIHVKAGRIRPLSYAMTAGGSHDFH